MTCQKLITLYYNRNIIEKIELYFEIIQDYILYVRNFSILKQIFIK
jgi:hypothetical protein